MADKLKSFFQKKVRDEKFKRAGKGHRLNEPSAGPSLPSTSSNNLPKRSEPTEGARNAAQAALARLENMKSNEPKLKTSQNAIQAAARRELEKERMLSLESKDLQDVKIDKKLSEVKEIPKNEILAVTGVYYKCPLISDEILDKETWHKKIEEFLSHQLSEEEAGLSACIVIHSCNEGKEKIKMCVETLTKYLDNIRNNPSEMKYWKIRMSNKVFQEKVKPIKGAMEFLQAAGFTETIIPHQDSEEGFLAWDPERSSFENLSMLIDALHSAEPVHLELDRNLQVLHPSDVAKRNALPQEFFITSTDELIKEQSERTKTIELNQTLMTQAMREKLMSKAERKYYFSVIRIRFPDNVILQGTFAVKEKFENIIEFLKEHLSTSEHPFHLKTATRETLTENDYEKTLEELKLVPAVILTFFWDCDQQHEETPNQSLKNETLSLLQSL